MNFSVDEELLMKCLKKSVHITEPKANIVIKNYDQKKCDIESGGAYLSGLIKVRVDYDCNGKSLKKSFIIKVPSLGINHKLGVGIGVYHKEKYVYEEILPQVKKKMKYELMPEHYETINSEILILEDLTDSGFIMQHNTWLNFNKCKFTLETVAEFHAASFKCHQENPNFFFKNQPETIFVDFMVDSVMQTIFTKFTRILEAEESGSNLINKLEKFKNKITSESIMKTCNQKEPWFKVLNHGDLYHNNILFKYNENDEVDGIKLVDFQACRWNSPIIDIIYFLTMSTEPDVFINHFNNLIDFYLLKLNENLQNLDCHVTYSKIQFNEDLESMNLFRIFILFWCSYFAMLTATNNFTFDSLKVITPEIIVQVRNHIKYKRCLEYFKHYDNIGVFDIEA